MVVLVDEVAFERTRAPSCIVAARAFARPACSGLSVCSSGCSVNSYIDCAVRSSD